MYFFVFSSCLFRGNRNGLIICGCACLDELLVLVWLLRSSTEPSYFLRTFCSASLRCPEKISFGAANTIIVKLETHASKYVLRPVTVHANLPTILRTKYSKLSYHYQPVRGHSAGLLDSRSNAWDLSMARSIRARNDFISRVTASAFFV